MWQTQVWSSGQEDLLEKGMATHSSILARRILWTEDPGGLRTVHGVAKSCTWLSDEHFHKGDYLAWSYTAKSIGNKAKAKKKKKKAMYILSEKQAKRLQGRRNPDQVCLSLTSQARKEAYFQQQEKVHERPLWSSGTFYQGQTPNKNWSLKKKKKNNWSYTWVFTGTAHQTFVGAQLQLFPPFAEVAHKEDQQ